MECGNVGGRSVGHLKSLGEDTCASRRNHETLCVLVVLCLSWREPQGSDESGVPLLRTKQLAEFP